VGRKRDSGPRAGRFVSRPHRVGRAIVAAMPIVIATIDPHVSSEEITALKKFASRNWRCPSETVRESAYLPFVPQTHQ
jgi:hypothetical protein